VKPDRALGLRRESGCACFAPAASIARPRGIAVNRTVTTSVPVVGSVGISPPLVFKQSTPQVIAVATHASIPRRLRAERRCTFLVKLPLELVEDRACLDIVGVRWVPSSPLR